MKFLLSLEGRTVSPFSRVINARLSTFKVNQIVVLYSLFSSSETQSISNKSLGEFKERTHRKASGTRVRVILVERWKSRVRFILLFARAALFAVTRVTLASRIRVKGYEGREAISLARNSAGNRRKRQEIYSHRGKGREGGITKILESGGWRLPRVEIAAVGIRDAEEDRKG